MHKISNEFKIRDNEKQIIEWSKIWKRYSDFYTKFDSILYDEQFSVRPIFKIKTRFMMIKAKLYCKICYIACYMYRKENERLKEEDYE